MKKWFNGPDPFPKLSWLKRASDIYFLAFSTANLSSTPLARLDAIAEDSVQPVPCVLGLSILLP